MLRVLDRLPRLGLRCVQHLCPLALALAAVAVDVRLALLQLALPPRDLFLRLAELRGGRGLGVALDRVCHLGGSSDHVQRVHPHRMAGRLETALACCLQDA